MKSIIALVVCSCGAVFLATASAEEKTDHGLPALHEQMEKFIAEKQIAGAVTLVGTRDSVRIDVAGLADIEAKKPMTADSIFWIASMTKPITATGIMMLQDEGKLSVDDPVSKYLPELGKLETADHKPANLTLRHLLTHTSGMAEASGEESRAARTLADLIPAYAKHPVKFEPGTKWEYCQSGINSLGRIIEVASGQSLPQFLKARLFDPLGMKDTTFYPTKEQAARIARSYRLNNGNLEAATVMLLNGKEPTDTDRYPAANGGLYSTAGDYARFCQMILNHGSAGGKQYLKPETVKQMTTIQTGNIHTGFTEGNGWGLGWCVVRSPQGVTSVLSPGSHGHGGAYGTQAWIDPAKGVFYVLMVQRSNFPNSDASDVRKAFQEAAGK